MRLLYVSGTYAPGAFSGSELSAHTLVRELGRRGHAETLVVTDCRYTAGAPGEEEYEGVPLRGVRHRERQAAIAATIDAFRPDVVLTQLIWCDVALRVARERGTKSVLRVPSLPLDLDVGGGSELAPTALLAPTEFAQREIEATSGRRPFLVRSAIDVARALVSPERRRPRYLTMFNPIELKGGHLFRDIARRMPEREFAAVPGWQVLRNPDGSWNRELFRRSAESTGGEPSDWEPGEVALDDLANVTLLAPREEVAEIFALTRLLLVPSIWPEVTGRVSVEAFANGIPVVASAVGGLADHVGRAGVAVESYRDPEAWVGAIRSLDDAAAYERCAELGRRLAAEEFSLDRAVDEFATLAGRLAELAPGQLIDAP